MEKQALRTFLFTARQSSLQNPIAEEILDQIKNNISIAPNLVIAGYFPIKNEASVLPILKQYFSTNTISLPVVINRDLIFRKWNMDQELVDGPFNLFEPSSKAKEVIPDILLVPCLGMCKNGHRLGYGYGYYDRYINSRRKLKQFPLTIGIGYSYQIIPNIPFTNTDAKLDWIVTDKKALKVK